MLEMLWVEPGEVPVVAPGFPRIFREILLRQNAVVHRCPFIGIGARFPKIVGVMFWKDTEADFELTPKS